MIRRFLILLLLVLVSTSLACDDKPARSTAVGFVAEVGPLEVGITLDDNGEVSLVSGISRRARFSLGPVSFRFSVESAQALTQERTHYLFLVWRDKSGDLQRDEYEVGKSFNVTFNHGEWVREIQGINGNVIVVVERDSAEQQPSSPVPFQLSIDSRIPWVDTEVDVIQGQTLELSSWGSIATIDQGMSSGPNGQTPYICEPQDCLLPGQPYGALIGRIGNGGKQIVGDYLRWEVTSSGRLFLSVNDKQENFPDNRGSFTVRVTITEGV